MNYAVVVVRPNRECDPCVVTNVYDKVLGLKSISNGDAIYSSREAAEDTAEKYRKAAHERCSNDVEYEVIPANVVGGFEEVEPERVVPAVTRFVIRPAFERK